MPPKHIEHESLMVCVVCTHVLPELLAGNMKYYLKYYAVGIIAIKCKRMVCILFTCVNWAARCDIAETLSYLKGTSTYLPIRSINSAPTLTCTNVYL